MADAGNTTREEYVRLTEHSPVQLVIFTALTLSSGIWVFLYVALPFLDLFFAEFLDAEIVRGSGFSEYLTWEVAVTEAHTADTRDIIINPLLAFIPFCASFGLAVAFYVTAMLPPKYGYVYQKIQREIVNSLDKVARIIYHENVETEHREVEKRLIELDIRHIHELAAIHNISFDELKTLRRALIWRKLSGIRKMLNAHDGIRLYMRNYFTIEYGNGMLGIVYIGAAVLIIVIGLRGLKFIPASAPSVVVFALNLEFILLLAYAVTVIYTKEEEQAKIRENGNEEFTTVRVLESISTRLETMADRDQGLGAAGFPTKQSQAEAVNAQEVENLLRVFLNRPKDSASNKPKL